MELIGIIVLVIIVFVVLGVGGWFLKLLGYVFDFLLEGFLKSIGCLFWVLIILLILFSIGS